MWKTFVASPVAGGISAVLGWLGALLVEGSMSEAEFANLPFGWAGAIAGGTAIAVILFLSGSAIEPLMTVAIASVGAALLWNVRELPISIDNFLTGTTNSYWYAVSMMVGVFIVLLGGLRSARESNNRARG